MSSKKISSEALDVLSAVTYEGSHVKLPPQTLDRALYVEVNDVLSRLGGKWVSGKTKAHVFPDDPREMIADVVASGEMPIKNADAYFPTPPAVARTLMNGIDFSAARSGVRILEPSAGTGVLVEEAIRYLYADNSSDLKPTIHTCEINESRCKVLMGKGYTVVARDFLSYQPEEGYDFIVMNPPFAVAGDRLAWRTHLKHAYSMLKSGGTLAAIVPNSLVFRNDLEDLRAWVKLHGSWEDNPVDAFKESGTGVSTVCLWLTRPVQVAIEPIEQERLTG